MSKHLSSVPVVLVRNILFEQIDRAILGLEEENHSDESIHDVRKDLKRARATLRLMRASLHTDLYREANCAIRDAARPLAPIRDAKVLVQTLRLVESHKKMDAELEKRGLSRMLKRSRRITQREVMPQELLNCAESLKVIRRRIGTFSDPGTSAVQCSLGLGRAYREGRNAFGRIKNKSTNARLHEWRKQVQYFLNEIEVVQQLVAVDLKKEHRRCYRLADVLGNDHDLSMLQAKILQLRQSGSLGIGTHHVEPLIARRRNLLQHEACRIAKRFYSKSGKTLEEQWNEKLRRGAKALQLRRCRR